MAKDISEKDELDCRVEALKQLHDWSKGLIALQMAAAAALGFWLLRDAGTASYCITLIAIGSLVGSILYGSIFLATTIVHVIAYAPYQTGRNIYGYKGGYPDNEKAWVIGTMVWWQSLFFCISVAAVCVAV